MKEKGKKLGRTEANLKINKYLEGERKKEKDLSTGYMNNNTAAIEVNEKDQ
ncbi:hypothetical protein [Halobacillus litoralis]|uniref:hypothetical protein n=1 Tax=Halobacillus litoralis TaxID=45668 RepID=UPI001CFEA4F6|nr:hypothetical protein [Halobacillus litoralis]